jgi:glycosyltransferase involved in cell wall biosynthesis
MRVVHVSPVDVEGGAAKGAYNLHKALQAAGADSLMLVQRKYSDDPSIISEGGKLGIIREGLRDRLDRVPLSFYDWRRENWWTVGWLPFDVRDAVDRLKPDIVHFHWSGRGGTPIETLKRLGNYKMVWTLRDMWPITGGCHYSGGCDRYVTGCGTCPQLGSTRQLDISRWQWRRKHRAWRNVNMTYVALSRWIAECARRSPLTYDNEITVIPNGIDVDRFAPVDQRVARSFWQLPQDKRVILFGALQSTTDPRKGYRYLREALVTLAEQGWTRRAMIVVFGAGAGETQAGFETRYVGHLRDEVSLASLYAAADVMVVPSIEENFGKTAVEALACGTPVAAFNNTGVVDIIDHWVNGYLAQHLSPTDLARGIAWCLEQGQRGNGLSRRSREKAVRCFSAREVANRYVALYDRLLGDQRKAGRAALPTTTQSTESMALAPAGGAG